MSSENIENEYNENSAQKQIKTFIIKKKIEKGEMRKLSGELESPRYGGNCPSSAGQSPTNIRISHVPSRFSCFKTDSERIKTIDINERRNEEGKNEFCEVETRRFVMGELEPTKKDSKNGFYKYTEDSLSHDDMKTSLFEENKLVKKNSIILRKDSQINFNVKLGDVLGEGKKISHILCVLFIIFRCIWNSL